MFTSTDDGNTVSTNEGGEETKELENKEVNKVDEGLLTRAVLGTTPPPTPDSGAVGGSGIAGDAEKIPKVPNKSEIVKTLPKLTMQQLKIIKDFYGDQEQKDALADNDYGHCLIEEYEEKLKEEERIQQQELSVKCERARVRMKAVEESKKRELEEQAMREQAKK